MYLHKNGTILRKINHNDLTDLLLLKEESWWGTHTTNMLNMEDQEAWYKSLPKSTLCVIANVGCKNVAIAIISEIDFINRTAKLSGSIYKMFRKDELIKSVSESVIDYCFEMLNLHRLDCEVLETNYGAQKYWINHLKFVVEGRRRKAVYKCGKYYDSIVLGMLRDDWQKHDRVLICNGSCNQSFDHELASKLIHRSQNYILESRN